MRAERLDELRFQATHKGCTPNQMVRLKRESIDPSAADHGRMIVVTPTEMMELLEAHDRAGEF